MPRKIKFETISSSCPKNAISLPEIIAEKKLLKTQIKLLHIAAFDRDLKRIKSAKKSLTELNLSDFFITSEQNIIVPVQERITKKRNHHKVVAKSYLVYLSYLYNVDFSKLYEDDPLAFYQIILSLNISEELKRSLCILLQNKEDTYFSTYLPDLNTPLYRECLEEDKINLTRNLK